MIILESNQILTLRINTRDFTAWSKKQSLTWKTSQTLISLYGPALDSKGASVKSIVNLYNLISHGVMCFWETTPCAEIEKHFFCKLSFPKHNVCHAVSQQLTAPWGKLFEKPSLWECFSFIVFSFFFFLDDAHYFTRHQESQARFFLTTLFGKESLLHNAWYLCVHFEGCSFHLYKINNRRLVWSHFTTFFEEVLMEMQFISKDLEFFLKEVN